MNNEQINIENICPICKHNFDSYNNRLIVEICGHKKCRTCLIYEENGCAECKYIQNISNNTKSDNSLNVTPNDLTKLQSFQHEKPEIQIADTLGVDSSSIFTTIETQSNDDGLHIDTIINANDGDERSMSNCSNTENQHKTPPICPDKTLSIKRMTKKRKKPRIEYPTHLIETKLNGNVIFKCTICNKEFKSLNNRRYHFYCDDSLNKPYKCDKCDKEFITPSHLNYHLKTHEASDSFECNECARVFLRIQSLRKHMKKHEGKFKHACNNCGKKFLYKDQAILHEHKHNNTFQFQCAFNLCNKSFTTKSNLRQHIQIHSGVIYICDMCKREFNKRSLLKCHMRIHSKRDKELECKDCFKLFFCQNALDRHMKTHKCASCFQCPLCPIKSTRHDNIRRHIRNLHTDKNIKELYRQISSTIEYNKKINDNEIATEIVANFNSKPTEYDEIDSIDNEKEKSELKLIPDSLNSCSVIKFAGRSEETTKIDYSNEFTVKKSFVNIISNEVIKEPDRSIIINTPLEINITEPIELQQSPPKNVQIYRQLLSPYLKPPKEVIENSNANTKQIHTTSAFNEDLPIVPKFIDNRHNNKPIRKRYDNLEIYRQILMPNRIDENEEILASNRNVEVISNKSVVDVQTEPNRSQSNFAEMHWRKRTSQCFSQMKVQDFNNFL